MRWPEEGSTLTPTTTQQGGCCGRVDPGVMFTDEFRPSDVLA